MVAGIVEEIIFRAISLEAAIFERASARQEPRPPKCDHPCSALNAGSVALGGRSSGSLSDPESQKVEPNHGDLLFSVPWYLPTVTAIIGLALLVNGNRRQNARLRNIGGLVMLWRPVGRS